MRILHVVGTRPNFVKAAAVVPALAGRKGMRQTLIHTGQHYDPNLSDVFFQELGIPQPDVNLDVGSGSHAWQTAEVMRRLEPVVVDFRPDLAAVYGDVNSTLAAAVVCAKLQVPVAHVEAGLRSFDRSMPEEVNRVLTDHVAELLFAPSADAAENLLREGIAPEKVHLIGNVIIDTLARLLPAAEERWPDLRDRWGADRYALVTLHRPSNVDAPETLLPTLRALTGIADELPVFFPVHPRTRARMAALEEGSSRTANARVHLLEPLGYLDFLAMERHATVVITDSGGVQEETTWLGVPCFTVRPNTERPITVTLGTNTLVGQDMDRLRAEVERVLGDGGKKGQVPPLWDGHAAERIAEAVRAWAAKA